MTDEERFDHGLAVRRAVVGDARVEASLMGADDFSRPLQEIMTRFAWGEIWSEDDAIDRRSRSIMTLGMLVALNRSAELKVHVLGALNNGLTFEEVRALFIHSAVYCGFPAALEATRVAQSVISERA